MSYAIHKFYKEKGFRYLTVSLITGSDCEGGGAMFRVTNLNLEDVKKQGQMNFGQDFFRAGGQSDCLRTAFCRNIRTFSG
jgi:asparaginyl-tRNA synthetase